MPITYVGPIGPHFEHLMRVYNITEVIGYREFESHAVSNDFDFANDRYQVRGDMVSRHEDASQAHICTEGKIYILRDCPYVTHGVENMSRLEDRLKDGSVSALSLTCTRRPA